MGFRNNNIGYPTDVLSSRGIIEKGAYALIPADGMVKNMVPGFSQCDITILSSPKLGATFVDYLVTVLPGGKTETGFAGHGVESFIYVLSGSIEVSTDDTKAYLEPGGYAFCPPSQELFFKQLGTEKAELFLYKRRYKPLKGYDEPKAVINHVKNLEFIAYEGMEGLHFYNFLPTDDFSYDMNFHILSFQIGASHGFIETHVQEHGAYIYEGTGMYNLGNKWMPVKAGDYIFMGAYTQQVAYGVGADGPFSYVYSKDCNRDEDI